MKTVIGFQEPSSQASRYLDALHDAASGATSGGGIFAWATRAGLETFLGHESLVELLHAGEYRLIVGTDAITDERAIAHLRALSAQHKNLSAQAFVHGSTSLFHPKLAWFRRPESLQLLIGSGNLTNGGLVNNWEAFTVTEYNDGEISPVEATISAWLDSHAGDLRDLDHEDVANAVAANKNFEHIRKSRETEQAPGLGGAALAAANDDPVLIAEIPKNRQDSQGRAQYSQVNFDHATFQDFFGYRAIAKNAIVLVPVSATNVLGPVESTVARHKPVSSNWYFEIRATQGRPYPQNGRPIVAYRQVGNGEYVYFACEPGQPGYVELEAILEADQPLAKAGRRMRRVVTSSDALLSAWPNCPLA